MQRILILEDSLVQAELLKSIITSNFKDLKIKLAPTVAKARELINAYEFDIFLLDIVLPDGDGNTFAHEIRSCSRNQNSWIIVVSSQNDVHTDILPAYENYNCYRFITKPFDNKKVIETLQSILNKKIVTEAKLVTIRKRDFNVTFKEADLNYVEIYNREAKLHMNDKVIPVKNMTLKWFLENLSADNFIQCHKSYIIRKQAISTFELVSNKWILTLKNGSQVYVGDKYVNEVKDSFYKFNT